MNEIRAKFEEIWPVPFGIGWNAGHGRYMVLGRSSLSSGIAAVEYQARLDTFTRCQETTSVVLSCVEELVRELEICGATGWYSRRVLENAKKTFERNKR